jgi:hypothetical protein
MATERWIRASDQDRESAAQLLGEGFATGRLTREELDERAAAAYSAKTWGELRDLTADLPPPPSWTRPPSGKVASRGEPRNAGRHLIALMVWSFVLPLWAGLAGPARPLLFWTVTLLIVTALLLPAALRIDRRSSEQHGHAAVQGRHGDPDDAG